MTRTYTRYFGEDQVGPLQACIAELEEDWQGRRPHIGREAREAGDHRLALLKSAAALVGDPVVE